MHPSTAKAIAARQPAPAGPAWIEVDPQSGPNKRAFRCQTCGCYLRPDASGKLPPHYWHLVGKQKRREPQFQCADTHTYSTTDTPATPYNERTAIITNPANA